MSVDEASGRVGGRWRRAPLGAARGSAGWVLALVGPPLLTVLLLQQRDILGLPTDLMFFFTLVVVTALVGGLFPSLVCAVLGSSLLNYFFTDPTGGLTIDAPEQALAVVIFTIVAVAVASLVDVAERRSVQAREAQAEASALAELSRAVLGGADTPQGLVDELARRFAVARAALLERDGPDEPWRTVAAHPPVDAVDVGLAAPDPRMPRPVGPDLASSPVTENLIVADRIGLAVPGRALGPRDRRVLAAFAAQAELVLERARLRERADQARELEQGNAVRTALLTAASHDLRTPLAAIRAAVDGLGAGARDDAVVLGEADRVVLVETIELSTSRLERLIDNLLDLSMLDTGAIRPELRAVSLEEVIPAAVDSVADPGVMLDVAETTPLVLTDPGLLERVVANLVSNAMRFSPDEAPVEVTAVSGPEAVEVCVVDHGPGVPEPDRERMFQAFQRLGDAPADAPARSGGLGLGLAVARGLADAVGARIEARDTPGGGLTMVVVVPRARPDVTPAPPAGSRSRPGGAA